jgi:hypothetical protein
MMFLRALLRENKLTEIMKHLSVLICFNLFIAAGALAQKTASYPLHVISKDIQRMQFKNVAYKPSIILTGNAITTSKGIHRINANANNTPTGYVVMTGRPSFVVSKGVARWQDENKK